VYALIKHEFDSEALMLHGTDRKAECIKNIQSAMSLLIKLMDFNMDSFLKFTNKSKNDAEENNGLSICDYLIKIMHAGLFDVKENTVLQVTQERITDIMSSILMFSEMLGYSFFDRENSPVLYNCFKTDFYEFYAEKLFAPLTIDFTGSSMHTQWHSFLIDNLLRFMNQILAHQDDINGFFTFLNKTKLLEKMGHLPSADNYFFLNEILAIVSYLFFHGDSAVQSIVMKTDLVTKFFQAVPYNIETHSMFTGGLSNFLDRVRVDGSKQLQMHIVDTFGDILNKFTLTTSYSDLRERLSAFRFQKDESPRWGPKEPAESNNSFSEEINEEKYFDSVNNVPDGANSSVSDESESKRKKLENQYENIFLGLKPNNSKDLFANGMPGLYSPRPNDPLSKKINIKVNNSHNNIAQLADDLGIDMPSGENVTPTAALVHYSSSSSSEDENFKPVDQESHLNKENVKKLQLDTESQE